MADPTTAQSDPAGAGGSGWELELSMAYIKSIPGMLKIVEFVCILYYLQNKRPPPPLPQTNMFLPLVLVLIRNVVGD